MTNNLKIDTHTHWIYKKFCLKSRRRDLDVDINLSILVSVELLNNTSIGNAIKYKERRQVWTRLYSVTDATTSVNDCTKSLHRRPKKNRLRGRQLVSVSPSVALQMKTLNNLVAGCKSRREATLIDTRRRVPRRYTAREHL